MATKSKIYEEEIEKKSATMEDRLSNIPEGLQLCILSSLDVKYAVQTSTLAKTWVPLWTWIPVLEFNYYAFGQLPRFEDFVDNVLSRRDHSARLLRLSFTGMGLGRRKFIKAVLDYAFTHSVEELEVDIPQIDKHRAWPVFPHTSCESLKSLKLKSCSMTYCSFLGPRSGSLFKNLTVLYLKSALITDHEPFLGFPVLEKLTLVECDISNTLNVHATNLSDLTISDCRSFNCCELTTPKLRFFKYEGSDFPQLRIHEGLDVLDTIVVDYHGYGDMHEKRKFDDLLSLFCALRSAKSVKLLWSIVDFVSLFQDELMTRSSPFRNLECLEISFSDGSGWLSLEQFRIASNLKSYLLRNSPHAKFTILNVGVEVF